jgi:hypothetical protein
MTQRIPAFYLHSTPKSPQPLASTRQLAEAFARQRATAFAFFFATVETPYLPLRRLSYSSASPRNKLLASGRLGKIGVFCLHSTRRDARGKKYRGFVWGQVMF